jgi:hypothetical protein
MTLENSAVAIVPITMVAAAPTTNPGWWRVLTQAAMSRAKLKTSRSAVAAGRDSVEPPRGGADALLPNAAWYVSRSSTPGTARA